MKTYSAFWEIILHYTKKFEIHKNNYNMKVFILKTHYVQKISSGLFKNAKKVITPIRKAISSLDWA